MPESPLRETDVRISLRPHERSQPRTYLKPAEAVNPKVKVIIKYPHWYDDFHRRGYDVLRQTAQFDLIWAGTESRDYDFDVDPRGQVQYLAYFNMRWLSSIGGARTGGGWFDALRTTPKTYLEQARQTVLGDAKEMMLCNYRLLTTDTLPSGWGQGWEGTGIANVEALRRELPGLFELAKMVRNKPIKGIMATKPANSDPYDDFDATRGFGAIKPDAYIYDFVGMLGLPLVPSTEIDTSADAAVFPFQVLKDPTCPEKLRKMLSEGKPVLITDGLAERLGDIGEYDNLIVLPVNGDTHSLLKLSPKELNAIRDKMLEPFGMNIDAPGKVGLYLLGDDIMVIENFNDESVDVTIGTSYSVKAQVKLVLPQEESIRHNVTGNKLVFNMPPRTLVAINYGPAGGTQAADAAGEEGLGIDRQAVVSRHNIRVNSSSELQVGNGEFAITTDISGLISFSNSAILAHWGWHSDPLPSGQTIDDFEWTIHRGYDGRERPYPLPNGSEIGKWLMSNPHKANLGRLCLVLIKEDGSMAGMADLQNPKQTLDLWKGLLTSQYDMDGLPVKVETCVHPTWDAIAVRITSPLINAGRLRIRLTFPYPNLADGGSGDFTRPDAHTSNMESRGSRRADIARIADATSYHVGLAWAGGGKLENPAKHEFLLSPEAANQFEFVCTFTPQALPETLPSAAETIDACAKHWPDFWNSGGAIDLSGSSDSRWRELERRIVMSQYAMAVNEAGSYPPPESGLTKDPWHGRFHFEMIWWHGTHWALWDRWPLLNRYLDIYQRYLPGAQETARKQRYKGARWFKCTGNTPVEWPWTSHSWLVWQHPHPIFFAEMDYRAHPTEQTLEKWREVVFNTADFLASFPSRDKENPDRLVLGFPIEDMSEQNPHCETINPAFDLGYFRFGLRIAQRWRERLGMPRDSRYDDVLEHLSPVPVRDRVYIMWESVSLDSGLRDTSVDPWANPKWISDHPSVTGLYGMLPGDGVDLETMQRTYDKVLQTWPRYKWGWDYGMMAMAAARLGRPETAVDFLLHPDNRYTTNGISGGWYFPGNGALLYAVAMMAAGWDGCPEGNAPGFPNDGTWNVKWEGLKKAP